MSSLESWKSWTLPGNVLVTFLYTYLTDLRIPNLATLAFIHMVLDSYR